LAEAVGWPFESKRMVYRPTELVTNRLLGVTLLGIDRDRSSPLEPPWPELVISAGRRNEPVARWIQREAGGADRCRLVHVGRPWAPIDAFDLIVTSPQYALPRHPRILHAEAPLHRIGPTALAAAVARWRPRLADLPEPRTAVMLGGHVGPWTFDAAKGRDLGRRANELAAAANGSLLVSTSARTPTDVADAIDGELRVPHRLYRWRRDDPDNPYLGFLALAERIIVTSDSMSMLVEATATGKPVLIYDLADRDGRNTIWRLPTLRALTFQLGRALGPRQIVRDVTAVHRAEVAAGRAVWLGQEWPTGKRPPPPADAQAAAARVRELFAG
jgi:uncharacterized protein